MIQIRYNLLYAALAKGNMKQNNTNNNNKKLTNEMLAHKSSVSYIRKRLQTDMEHSTFHLNERKTTTTTEKKQPRNVCHFPASQTKTVDSE